ncbi:hypothetical protein [Natronomonas gomsonensis]|uniref:hypothetical protein n=1 Tax=Natronomonas gomsonensis TaxID=1046043 RepID=UPI0015B97FF1|nr:hypothetical protein [Natronomonas gomsonensis]
MPESSIDPDQIEVEAEFYFKQEDGTPSLSSKQMRLLEVMTERGFEILNNGDRVLEFIFRQPQPNPSLWWRVKERTGLAERSNLRTRESLESLNQTRNNQPYRLTFRFVRVVWEDGSEGYSLEVESIPALSEKIDRLNGDFQDANLKSVVRTNKRFLKDIATEVGVSISRRPFTRSENYRDTLESHLRQQLRETNYGSYVVNFADEADEAFRYSLMRPALCAYVHGIEWAIICYIADSEGRDIVEEEGYDRGLEFRKLIDEVEETGAVSQTTSEALHTMNTERIWMAHHKSGPVTDIEVKRVKQRFNILLEELFL